MIRIALFIRVFGLLPHRVAFRNPCASLPLIACLLACIAPGSIQGAETLKGAALVLKQAAESAHATNKPAKPASKGAQWQASVRALSRESDSLPPKDAAQKWLALSDALADLVPSDFSDSAQVMREPAQELSLAFPPPAAWPALAEAISARPEPTSAKAHREFGLRMLASSLTGDLTGVSQRLRQLEKLVLEADPRSTRSLLRPFTAIDEALLSFSDDPEALIAGIERQIASSERAGDRWYRPLLIPDLVALVGEGKAAPILKRALLSPATSLRIEGAATLELARTQLLANIKDVKIPRWELAADIRAPEVYEALARQFEIEPTAKPNTAAGALAALEQGGYRDDQSKHTAKTYYLMGLIARDRLDDASRFAEKAASGRSEFNLSPTAVIALERAGNARTLDQFLHDLLSRNPRLPYWSTYLSVAAKTGNTDRMLALARATATRPDLDGTVGNSIRQHLFRALLAADRIDEAAGELRRALKSETRQPDADGSFDSSWSDALLGGAGPCLTLAQLGSLLDRPEWVKEGLEAALKTPSGVGYLEQAQARQIVASLMAAGRHAEAEEKLADQLALLLRQTAGSPRVGYSDPSALQEHLGLLAMFYHRVGRHSDVLTLLETSPNWGSSDLVQIIGQRFGGEELDLQEYASAHSGSHVRRHPLAHAAAAALIKAGRTAEAIRIVEFMLDQYPEDDRGYELLIELAGQDAMARLDALFARDPFQERPLIWKALLLLQSGKLEDAERVARQAVRIDPSDGEQGKGDRMRVYTVLADIRAARGDTKEADVLRGAVKAIRFSERADDFFATGLLSRAITMYEDSLKHFTDAYCIQSRLAVQLSDLGQHERAAQHYQKAFELMPDSFGRIESHCFGCERTFAAAPAQSVADRVFSRLAQENPDKPQVHYLLGYLREQQGLGKTAIPHFRRALQLDPDYLNAWVRLQELSRDYRLPMRERDEIAFQLLRLDPLKRHASADFQRVSDLPRLWTALSAARIHDRAQPKSLLILAASRDAIERRRLAGADDGPASRFESGFESGNPDSEESDIPSPRHVLTRHSLINAILQLVHLHAGIH